MYKKKSLIIVSRQSRLALVQANLVANLLREHYPDLQVQIQGITASGDQVLDIPLHKVGGKGLFVKELQQHLLDKTADIAVHSMKDVPTESPDNLCIGAILPRADARDAFLSARYTNINSLPVRSIVGTSSLRRQAQLLLLRPDLQVKFLRGNVESRINKLLRNEYDAIILAVAGLERLNLTEWLNFPLSVLEMLPAVGQGALGIEQRVDDFSINKLLQPLVDNVTTACVSAERSMNAKLDGGCYAPVAGYAMLHEGKLWLRGLVISPEGDKKLYAQASGSIEHAQQLGLEVADQLLQQGAFDIISKFKQRYAPT